MTFLELARRLALAGAALAALTAQGQGVPVRVCLPDIEAPPFLYRDVARPGLVERLLTDAGREAGLRVVVMRQPSARCRVALARGEADAMSLPGIPAYLEALDFPLDAQGRLDAAARLGRLQFVLLRRRGDAPDWDGQRLTPAGVTVGVRRGVKTLTERLQPLGVVLDDQASTVQQLLAKLQAGRIDLAAMSREEFRAASPSGIEALPVPLVSTDLHLAVSRRVAAPVRDRLPAWREHLARLRDSAGYRSEDFSAPGS